MAGTGQDRRFVAFKNGGMFMYKADDGEFRAIGVSRLVPKLVDEFMETDSEELETGLKLSESTDPKDATNILRDRLAEEGYPEVQVTTETRDNNQWIHLEK